MENEENETCDAGFLKKKISSINRLRRKRRTGTAQSQRQEWRETATTRRRFFSSQVADASKLGRAHWAQTIILKPNFIFSTRVLCMFAYDLPWLYDIYNFNECLFIQTRVRVDSPSCKSLFIHNREK